MKSLYTILKIIISTFFIVILFEFFIRCFFFFLTNKDVFKYGFKGSIIFEIVDLSKFQITIVDKDRKLIKFSPDGPQKIWIFGGSTTAGYNCEGNQSSSWPDEIYNLNKNFVFNNFAFNGANSDQQINLFWKEITKQKPDIILWASKFNTRNIINKSDYRNKEILKYEFNEMKKNRVLIFLKKLDKSLQSYLLSYSFLSKILERLNLQKKDDKKFKISENDIYYSLKNFELNTEEIINTSKKYGVKEFYIVSLFSTYDIDSKSDQSLELYKQIINNLEKKYSPYVKIIENTPKISKENEKILFCDSLHKTLKGEILQGEIIYNSLIKKSEVF